MGNYKNQVGHLVQEYQEKDDWAICDLQRVVYPDHFLYSNKGLSLAYWKWRYRSFPGKKDRIFGVPGTDCIAGLRPLSFFPIHFAGNEECFGFFSGTVTHPQYRRKGIFSLTLKNALNVAKEKDRVRYFFNFPNDNSFPQYMKNSCYHHLCDLPLYVKIFNPKKVIRGKRFLPESLLRMLLFPLQRSRKRGLPDGVKIRNVASFDTRFDDLWERVKDSQTIWIQRTSKYLNWRYVDSPLSKYAIFVAETGPSNQLIGYAVVSEQMRFGFRLGMILDIVIHPEWQEVSSIIISKAIKYLRRSGADAVGCLMLRHQAMVETLKDNGLICVPRFLNPKDFHVVIASTTNDEHANRLALNYHNWYLTWGDTDNV